MLLKRNKQTRSRYILVGGTVRGTCHRLSGTPNQDAHSFPKQCESDSIATAISDGHGSKLYFRSDFGSHAAAISGRQVLESLLTAGETKDNSSAAVYELLATRVPQTIYAEWRRRIDAHLMHTPISEFELADLNPVEESKVRTTPCIAYGCTLLAASMGTQFGALARIGDGTIAVVNAAGELMRPFTEDDAAGDESTNSLCQDDAVSKMETYHLDFSSDLPRCIILATDGYTKSFPNATAAQTGLLGLYRHLETHGIYDLERGFKEMLDNTTTSGSGDDTTVAMIINQQVLGQ